MRVKLEEKVHELVVCKKADDIIDVAAPFKTWKCPWRELFAFNEKTCNPEQLITDIGSAMLDF